MTTPDERKRDLADALGELENAATRVARLAGLVRSDMAGAFAAPSAPQPPSAPPLPPPPHATGWAPAPQPPPAPAQPSAPWWSDDKVALKATAAIGAFITIVGIILLLWFAIERGLIGPVGRVVLAYSVAAALAATSWAAARRNPGNAGVVAAATAAMITAQITTGVVVDVLYWWPVAAGSLIMLAVMGLAYAAARAWHSRTLLIIGLVTSFFATLMISGGVVGLTAMLVPSVAASWVWRGLPGRFGITTPAVLLFLLGSLVLFALGEPYVALVVVPIAVAAMAVPDLLGDPAPRARGLVPLGLLAWTAAPMVSVMAKPDMAAIVVGAVLAFAIGAAGVAPVKDRDDPRMRLLRLAGPASGIVPAVQVALENEYAIWSRIPVIVVAIGFAWFEVFRPSRTGRILVATWTAAALTANTPALTLTLFAPGYLIRTGMDTSVLQVPGTPLNGALIGALALGLIAITVANRRRPSAFDTLAGLLGLLLTAVPVVTLLTAAGLRFSLAHVLVSLGWMIAAAWLLLAPRRFTIDSDMAGSLAIAGVAALKLVFYDMQAMSGLTRVAAFLLCGVLMLGMVVARGLRDRGAELVRPATWAGGTGPCATPRRR